MNGAQLTDVYLPAITEKPSNLQAARANLSNSCPYVYGSRRRRSTSSVISQRASDFSAKPVKNQNTAFVLELKSTRVSVEIYLCFCVFLLGRISAAPLYTLTGLIFPPLNMNNLPLVTTFFLFESLSFVQGL